MVKSLSLVSDQGLDAGSEQQVPPFLTFLRKKKTQKNFITFKMSGEILDTGVLFSD